jgi:hypothetical protein
MANTKKSINISGPKTAVKDGVSSANLQQVLESAFSNQNGGASTKPMQATNSNGKKL